MVCLVKPRVFPVVMYGFESMTLNKAENRRIDAFELWYSKRFLRVPWTARRSNQSLVKEISSEYSLEELMLKLKLQNFTSVQFSHSVVSNSFWHRESQHARPPCPSPTCRVHADSCPSSQWCHPAISSSVVLFSSCPQSLPASGFSNQSTLHMR